MTLTDNARTILERRYLLRDERKTLTETPEQLFRRVAKALAETPEWEETFFDIMSNLRFLPNTPCLMNAGCRSGQLFACFVLPIDDSISEMKIARDGSFPAVGSHFHWGDDDRSGILDAAVMTALVQKSGGGTGYCYSDLRPRGDFIGSASGEGRTSGPIAFLRMMNGVTEAIQQGASRRGANMATFHSSHPSLYDFITCKDDGSSITNYNISITASDEFMEKVQHESDRTFVGINPRNGEEMLVISGWPEGKEDEVRELGNIARDEKALLGYPVPFENCGPLKDIGVRFFTYGQLFEKVIDGAWLTGDPGLIFVDRINRLHPLKNRGMIKATNPCWVGETLVSTVNGPRSFRDLAETGEASVICYDTEKGRTRVRTMRNIGKTGSAVPILKLMVDKEAVGRLRGDYPDRLVSYRLTPNHRLYIYRSGVLQEVEAKDLKKGDRLVAHQIKEQGWCGEDYCVLDNGAFRPIHRLIAEKVSGRDLQEGEVVHHKDGDHFNNDESNLEVLQDLYHKSLHMSDLNRSDPRFSKAGSKNGRWITVSNEQLLERGALLLRTNHWLTKKVWDRDCDTTGYPKVFALAKRFGVPFGGFKRMCEELLQPNHVVVSIEPDGESDVYNGTVDEFHNYFVCDPIPRPGNIVTGILSKNCGEQPLLSNESCVLGSLNLHKYAEHPGGVKWSLLEKDVRTAVRFLDNCIDRSVYPAPQIERVTKANRKIGLGVMGLADMFFALGVRYGSDVSFKLANDIMKFINKVAIETSSELAEEKGVCEAWKGSDWEKKGIPMRNGCVTTIAPTGTIARIAGCTSSIEPAFSLAFESHVLSGTKLLDINSIFEKALFASIGMNGKATKAVEEAMAKGSIQHLDWIPDTLKEVFVTARDIPTEAHIKMQAVFQEHVDSSISKTINMPNSATREDIRRAYLLAYQSGCKGITVYRDGCREKQVLNLKKKEVKKSRVGTFSPVEAPESLPFVGLKVKCLFGTLHTQIGVLMPEGKELEVFAYLGRGGDVALSDLEAICRLASRLLRGGDSIKDVWYQLQGLGTKLSGMPSAHGRITSLPGALAAALQMYMFLKEKHGLEALLLGKVGEIDYDGLKEGLLRVGSDNAKERWIAEKTPVLGQNGNGNIDLAYATFCPGCTQNSLVHEGGCEICYNCGYTMC